MASDPSFSALGCDDGSEGGWANVRELFKDFGKSSSEMDATREAPPQLAEWAQMTGSAGLIGFFAGGNRGMIQAREAHIANNANTLYHGQFHAQRELNYSTFMGYSSSGMRMAGRLALVTGVMVGTSILIDRYFARTHDIRSAVAAGTLTGAVFSLTRGPAGFARGVALGAGLSSVWGVARAGALWAGHAIDPETYASPQYNQARLDQRDARDLRTKEAGVHVTAAIIDDLDQQIHAMRRDKSP
ncbi:hypothetical protein CAOG_02589 [Capsaspora owczarzaki ATCC 30864]|uniref:Complex I assembly factor TIMMDC1, mitochondrial n=1 Tax=Capsaspora owczarzaki (strain ATCC 30864) TaxID=595528 RepID=A0A0D2WMM1_CAPO3|nr:hypothetical protein CAOG_02589 [Capsaspora owczarzaki ATCC 30864]KJE91458.1 hypothetical protein, variant [Capsaspora owczarzaki ATCC 30864]|eukprot:XP_004349339.1 hypothetical protein CAOG_02589 [Capsaspora owczarzaki ATCC 30864]